MKQLFFLLASILMLTGCVSSGRKSDNKNVENRDAVDKSSSVNVAMAVNVDQLMDKATDNVDKEVTVKGVVTHVCKHSGKRCFLKDESGKTSIRVEAKGEIGGFNSELNGTRMVVKGFVREKRLSEEYINQWEQKTIEQKEKAEIDENQCSAELANIEEMRDWMKANNKNFYSIFYLDGINYEVID
ncbi:OB-fold nucleic acid binding domain-containing protein [Thermophagus sp. OGC60D27]|uniref:OB-fold nucleic acid binding domain-containing protein n=1 Tax=Thermophagus sp. OGC60D27 TaxID=3458415 RepID=UPI0040381049